MKKRLDNHSEVIHFWANHKQSEGYCAKVFFDLDKIYSYGRHFCMARFHDANTVIISTRKYSVTTSSHQSAVRQYTRHHKQFFIHDCEASAIAQYNHYSKAINYQLELAAKATTKRDYYIAAARSLYDEIKAYAALLNEKIDLSELDTLSRCSAALLLSFKESLKAEKEKEKKRSAEEKQKIAEEILQWKKGEISTFRYSIPETYLRVNNDTVESTRRACITISEAKILLHAIHHNKPLHGIIVSGYTVISYDEKFLKIGCHTIPKSEIDYIDNLLKD